MGLLFGAHSVSLALVGIKKPSLLNDAAPGLNYFDVAFDLVLQRLADKAKRIDVLHFSLGAERFLPPRTHAHVCVAAKRSFLHVYVADAGVENDLLQPGKVVVSFIRRRDVWLADDLNQRHATAVEIEVGFL